MPLPSDPALLLSYSTDLMHQTALASLSGELAAVRSTRDVVAAVHA